MRKRIGVIIDTLDGQYQHDISNGLIKEALSHNCQLMFFSGQALHSSTFQNKQFDNIFKLPNPDTFDGIILIISTLKNLYGEEWTTSLLNQYSSIPLVSISIQLEGAVNICHDNEQGIIDIMTHMLTHADLHEIAYISGPLSNNEAVTRLNTYQNYYKNTALTYNENYCYEGNFLSHSGANAIDFFIANNPVMPKAIVCANDEMAIGAFLRLSELGYRVPEDILITGYDNVNVARDIFPPITTYDQDFHTMCKIAMKEMMAHINGNRTPYVKLSKGQLIVRESCGCSPLPPNLRKGSTHTIKDTHISYEDAFTTFETYLKNHYEHIESMIINQLFLYDHLENYSRQLSKDLIDGLIIDIKRTTVDGEFITVLNKLLRFVLPEIENPSNLQAFAQTLKSFLLSHSYHPQLMLHIQELFYVSITIIEENIRRKQRQQQFKFSNMYLMSRELILALNSSTTLEETCEVLTRHLPIYNINEFYLCLFEHKIQVGNIDALKLPNYSQLVLGMNKGRKLEQSSFITHSLLPKEILEADSDSNYVFLSLFSGKEQFGFIAFNMIGVDYLIFETLRAQISEALKRHDITKLRIQAEANLKSALTELELSNKLLTKQSIHDELTNIYNRRGFFSTSEYYFEEAKALKKSFYIIFADIDGLKYINDNFGHNEGDFAIKKISQLMNTVLDSQHIFARMSGDEFIILAKDINEDDPIKALIKYIHYQLDRYNSLKEKPYLLNISLGYAQFEPSLYTTLDQVILVADQNLYHEKSLKKQSRIIAREN